MPNPPIHVQLEVQEADFSLGENWDALQRVVGNGVGAMAGFTGLVRESTATDSGGSRVDEPVKALILEHYPGMTETSMQKIVEQARTRWELLAVHVIHRVGRLTPGEQIVMVLVASAHRADAFAACEYIMDYLKTDAVLWKREDYVQSSPAEPGTPKNADDSRWLHSADEDKTRRANWQD